MRTFIILLAVLVLAAPGTPQTEDPPKGPAIKNPYYTHATWRVWRDDATPVPNVKTLRWEGKQKKQLTIELKPTPVAKRIYPAGPLEDGKPVKWVTLATPSKRFAGIWDDVYASWSGLHGYVRSTWHTKDGSAVHLRPKGLDHIMNFVEVKKTEEIARCGINFVHQSTTGMAHTITNGYSAPMTSTYERIYFSDCLVAAPAHASYTEEWADRTKDMYTALVPTIFNSVGSSNSETLAITKMIVAGGYLPPESKRLLKRNGLYPAAMLYLWKASLPFDVPYDHELRHRICYRSLGTKNQFGSQYKHAGPFRGDLALDFHRYDEVAHMRGMIERARSMDVLLPEALLDEVETTGGKGVYRLKKTALVMQEPGKEVTIRVSTAKCYDLADRPLTVRWRLLYGARGTTCVPGDKPDTWVIRVPWDDSLPEGRTAIALVANNGAHDSNPAIVNVYRKRGDLPPNGGSPKDYAYDSPHANRRPVLLGFQDRIVKGGERVAIDLTAIDPEGQPVRFEKRAGEPGEIDGNRFTMTVPRGRGEAIRTVTFIASDASAGNSYAAKQVRFVTAPRVHAHIRCDTLVGPAPFTVKVKSDGSKGAKKLEMGWEFYRPAMKRKIPDWSKLVHGKTATHTFKKPGLYEVALTVKSGRASDRETISIWVTKGPVPKPVGGIEVEGNGVLIRDKDDDPSAFDHTHFGAVGRGKSVTRRFEILNRGGDEITGTSKAVTIAGEHAKEFRVTRAPRRGIAGGGRAGFDIRFKPKGGGRRTADVTVTVKGKKIRFTISGEGDVEGETK